MKGPTHMNHSTIDILPAAGPGKAAIITDRVADIIVSLASFQTGGSKLITVDLSPTPVAVATHAPRV